MIESTHGAKAVRALENCSYCPRLCHFACPTAHGESSETASAWGMMGLANLLRKGEVEPTRELATNLSRCTSCMRCTSFCKHENPVAEVLATARADLAAVGLIPLQLEALVNRASNSGGAPVLLSEDHASVLGGARGSAAVGYFPGCAALERSAARIEQTLQLLTELVGEPVSLVSTPDAACCGGWAERAGLAEQRASSLAAVEARASGYEKVISGCTSFESSTEVVPLMEFLADSSAKLASLASDAPADTVTLHGSCSHRRPDSSEPSELLILGKLGSLEVGREHAINSVSECCGGDPVYAAISPRAAQRAAQSVVKGSRTDRSRLVTASDRCARHMSESGDETVSSILDLVLERCSIPT